MLRSAVFMLSPRSLSAPAITQALQSLPGWRRSGNDKCAIECDYVFGNFTEAMHYMNAVAPVCEQMQHHPSWTNVYNRLHVRLTTHDAGNTVTQKDVDLAAAMNTAYAASQRK
ncbi:pterin-4-alpha-carbinolamine dehydratase [Novymonas esmeraldas]|uniref:4a-hydroxytetrahydrobiopterin dehydratase n=1 Tax=Novymonas esmeraldas TaxID=1808958 RepID=A0AAW0F384_9TRYP